MGEYAGFYIDGYQIDTWKNCVGWEASRLFVDSDSVELPEPYPEEVVDTDGAYSTFDEAPITPSRLGRQYLSAAGVLATRLDFLGYTLERAESYFCEALEMKCQRIREIEVSWPDTDSNGYAAAEIAFLSDLTFSEWLAAMSSILARKLSRMYSLTDLTIEQERLRADEPLVFRMLTASLDSAFAFPGYNANYMYRAMLHTVSTDTPVFIDYSWLVGWVGPDQYECSPPQTVVLTEGTSDKIIIEGTLALLYPELLGYFVFPDYDLVNFAGGAGSLLNIVRLLSATGTSRRTVAVFDNDTAGFDSLRQLKAIDLGDQIRAVMLPDLDSARNYPTDGPQGRHTMDINGAACSIELCLGQDILQDENGDLTPIRWSGYSPGACRYQGEIQRKRAIQDRYAKVMADASSDPSVLAARDWSDIRTVLSTILNSFADVLPEDCVPLDEE